MTEPKGDREVSDRGFGYYPQQTDLNGTTYYVSESSLATEPAVRVYLTSDHLHMSVDEARVFARRLLHACDNHYQLR